MRFQRIQAGALAAMLLFMGAGAASARRVRCFMVCSGFLHAPSVSTALSTPPRQCRQRSGDDTCHRGLLTLTTTARERSSARLKSPRRHPSLPHEAPSEGTETMTLDDLQTLQP